MVSLLTYWRRKLYFSYVEVVTSYDEVMMSQESNKTIKHYVHLFLESLNIMLGSNFQGILTYVAQINKKNNKV